MADQTAPDPMTNTAPSTDASTVTTDAEEAAWAESEKAGFLENEPRFEDEEVDEPKVDDTKPEVKEEVTEEKDEKTSEDDSALKEKLELFEKFDTALREKPESIVSAIFSSLSEEAKAEVLKSIGVDTIKNSPDTDTFDVDTYVPQGEFEEALKPRWNDIKALPKLISDTEKLKSEVVERQEVLIPHISEANVVSQIALVKIDAICDLLGIELPDADVNKVAKALGEKNSSYRDAVRKSVDYKKTVEDAKQKKVERPRTPAHSSAKAEPIAEGTGMVEIARRLGTLRR